MIETLAVGVDLGGTNLKIALVDRTARIVCRRSIPTAAARGPQSVVADIVRLIDELLRERALSRADFRGIGIATPGPLNLRAGRIIKAANLPGWHDVPLRDLIAAAVPLPAILENDANAAAFGEYWHGTIGPAFQPVSFGMQPERLGSRSHPAQFANLVLLTLGTGVGAGVILNGEILHGAFDNAAELGHMIVAVNGLPCPCGQRGCLEQYASAAAVARRVQQVINVGESTVLTEFLAQGEPLDATLVARAAAAGDPLAVRIWDDACLYLAVAIINIQHAYNPGLVLLGGGMSAAGESLISRVRFHLGAQCWSLHTDLPEVHLAALGNDAGVVGAAGLVWHRA